MSVLQKVSPNTPGAWAGVGMVTSAPSTISQALPSIPSFVVRGVKPPVTSLQGCQGKQPWDSETPKSSALLLSCRAARRLSKREKAGLCLPGETIKGSTVLLKLTRGTKT